MPYIVCKHPVVRIDIMAPEQYWARLAGLVRQTNCIYADEEHVELPNGNKYVTIHDIKGARGHDIGDLLGLVYAMENEDMESLHNKFYILIKPYKRGKNKHVQEDRPETGAGCESGDAGESGDIQPGDGSESPEDRSEPGAPDDGGYQQLEISFEEDPDLADDQ